MTTIIFFQRQGKPKFFHPLPCACVLVSCESSIHGRFLTRWHCIFLCVCVCGVVCLPRVNIPLLSPCTSVVIPPECSSSLKCRFEIMLQRSERCKAIDDSRESECSKAVLLRRTPKQAVCSHFAPVIFPKQRNTTTALFPSFPAGLKKLLIKEQLNK